MLFVHIKVLNLHLVEPKFSSSPLMDSVLRDPKPYGHGKSIVNPLTVKAVFNHGVSSSLNGDFYTVLVDPEVGKCHHYRDQAQGERSRQEDIRKVEYI